MIYYGKTIFGSGPKLTAVQVNLSEKYQHKFSVPEYVKNIKEYQIKYINSYAPETSLCTTTIKFKAIGYLGSFNQIKLIFNIKKIIMRQLT